MRPWTTVLPALLGFFIVVFALPQSNWIPLTQWDVLQGRWEVPRMGLDLPGTVQPIELSSSPSQTTNDPEAELLRLINPLIETPATDVDSLDRLDRRLERLYQICKTTNRADYWAQFVRRGSLLAQDSRIRPNLNETAARSRSRHLLYDGCVAGEHLDPKNCFFTIIKAGTLHCLGQDGEARRALLAAGDKPIFNDYTSFEVDMRNAHFISHNGFRGSQVRAWILFSIELPHLTSIRNLCRNFLGHQDAQARIAIAKIGDRLVRDSDYLIAVIVGQSIISEALKDSREMNVVPPDMARREAAKLEALGPMGEPIRSILNDSLGLARFEKPWPPSADEDKVIFNLRPAVSASSLAALLLLPIALALVWVRSRSPQLASVSPYLVWISIIPVQAIFGDRYSQMSCCGVIALLAIPALVTKWRRYVDLIALGIAVVVAAFATSLPIAWFTGNHGHANLPAFAISVYFIAATTMLPPLLKVPSWLTGIGLVAVCLGAAVAWVEGSVQDNGVTGLVWATPTAVGLASAVPVRYLTKLTPVYGIACAVLGSVYVGAVYNDISQERKVAATIDVLMHQAQSMRDEARITGK